MACAIRKGEVECDIYSKMFIYYEEWKERERSGNAQNQAFAISDTSQFCIHKHFAIFIYCNSNTYV